jgi:hypothetical protein
MDRFGCPVTQPNSALRASTRTVQLGFLFFLQRFNCPDSAAERFDFYRLYFFLLFEAFFLVRCFGECGFLCGFF